MALIKTLSFQKLANFFSNIILKNSKTPKRNTQENACNVGFELGFQKFQFLGQKQDLEDKVLIFNVEKTLLKSSSLFPYFMLVAFESGSLIRAFILLLMYPFITTLFRENFAVKVMVMICFFGINRDRFREGKAVLPKCFLEDVGMESFEVLRRGKKRVAISNLPQVMVECFLKDYLDIDFVFGKNLKVFCGYFVGIMEEKRDLDQNSELFQVLERSKSAIEISGFKRAIFDCEWLAYCKEIYLVSEQERRHWHQLPRHLYPHPLIFHDGRLAFRPTFLATLAMFMWLPLGGILGIIRIIIAITLPFEIAIPLMHFTGIQIRVSNNPNNISQSKVNKKLDKRNILYVCNHKTLLDPIVVSYGTRSPLIAVTYSISRISEIISPIKTVRLTRNKEKDSELMHKLLSQSHDLVVCPEGTTCREPYLLRFSPLFTEMSHDILPVAVNCNASMFYGTTARGLKFLDPLFFLMNPCPGYTIRFLDMVRGCGNESGNYDAENSRFEVANLVQNEIAKALGFTCTKLTRKDKYLILAGNEGIIQYGKTR